MYLQHRQNQLYFNRQQFNVFVVMQISWTVSDLVWGLALSLIVFLYVETPCRYLFKHVTTPSSKHRKSNIITYMITICTKRFKCIF